MLHIICNLWYKFGFRNGPYCNKVLQFGPSLGGILTFRKIACLHFLFLILFSKLTGYFTGLLVNLFKKNLNLVLTDFPKTVNRCFWNLFQAIINRSLWFRHFLKWLDLECIYDIKHNFSSNQIISLKKGF